MVEANKYLYSFTINGVEVIDTVVNYRVTDSLEEEADIVLIAKFSYTIKNLLTLQPGQSVVVSRGINSSSEDILFKGIVNTIRDKSYEISIDFKSRLQNYDTKRVKKSYDINIDTEAGVYSAIWADILEEGGLTASVVSSGTSIVAQKFICNDETRLNRLKRIANILNWQMYDDYNNDYVRLEPRGYTAYTTPLIVGDNVVNIPEWKEDFEPVRNDITVKGATYEDTIVQKFDGDNSTTEFTLAYTPEITNCIVDGVQQVQGIPGVDQNFDYSVDKDLKKITFQSGSVPASGTDNIVMSYTTKLPRPVRGKDYASITTYGITKEDIYEFKDVETVDDAQVRLQQLLSFLANPLVQTELKTYNTPNIHAGKTVSVQDQANPERNGSYVITKVVHFYPEPFDSITISSTDLNIGDIFRSINYRIEELERGTIKELGTLNQLISFNNSNLFENRYLKINNFDMTTDTDTLYWDTTTQGEWDNFDWADDSDRTGETVILIPGKNTYKEYVYDEEFYDSASSESPDWDTGTKEITIASGASPTAYTTTKQLEIGIVRTSFNLSLNADVSPVLDYLTIQISGDNGGTWQNVLALGVQTSFTNNDGTGVLLRLTSKNVGTVVLSTNGTIPAISLSLT